MKKAIVRIGLAAALGLAALGTGSAGAAPGGCAATAPGQAPGFPGYTSAMKCSYKASGTQAGYVAATPNPWKITVARKVGKKVKVVQTIAGDPSKGTAPAGSISVKVGDTITALILPTCAPAPANAACGALGFVGVGNA